jgi:hypothetical protein
MQFAPSRYKLSADELGVSAFFPGSALEYGGVTVPAQRHAEARERHTQHRLLSAAAAQLLPPSVDTCTRKIRRLPK